MEHFALDMQELLDSFSQGKLTFAELVERYHEAGSEGHDLEPYQALLEHVQAHTDCVSLHAGFVPKRLARLVLQQGPEVAIQQAVEMQWLPESMVQQSTTTTSRLLQGLTPFHYNYFESLLTGRNLHLSLSTATSSSSSTNSNHQPPSDRFAGIFQAQLLKDEGMAHKINQLLMSERTQPTTKKAFSITLIQ